MGRGLEKWQKFLLRKFNDFQANQECFHPYFETSSKPMEDLSNEGYVITTRLQSDLAVKIGQYTYMSGGRVSESVDSERILKI